MVKLSFAHLCDHAFLLKNGTPAIIGVFSKLVANSLPAYRHNTGVVLDFNFNDDKTHVVKFLVKSPSDKTIGETSSTKIGPPPTKGANLGFIINIESLQLEEEGIYNVEIIADEKIVDKLPFSLKLEQK